MRASVPTVRRRTARLRANSRCSVAWDRAVRLRFAMPGRATVESGGAGGSEVLARSEMVVTPVCLDADSSLSKGAQGHSGF
ncbi:MAG: hypothetical protein ACRYGI_18590 [Janthinobacterium lividum]